MVINSMQRSISRKLVTYQYTIVMELLLGSGKMLPYISALWQKIPSGQRSKAVALITSSLERLRLTEPL
jgi:hypothetical protein